MKIYRYWHKQEESYHGEDHEYRLVAWGGSSRSEQGARQDAKSKIDKMIERLKGALSHWDYDYLNSEIREPIVKESDPHSENPAWVITRNRYGALVLNVSEVAFLDVDCRPAGCLLPFGSHSKEKRLEQIARILDQSNIDAQVYETYAGYRVLVTSQLLSPTSLESVQLMESFKSDKLYARLCRKHECYRARLTPKPYRVGLPAQTITLANVSSPAIVSWLKEYERNSRSYSVCRLIRPSHSRPRHRIIEDVQKIHDSYCLDESSPLA